MARTNSLTNFLTDVADAIKEKKGSEADITASNFDTEILNLPAQGVYQQKTVSVTQNGTTTVIPDANYDAIDQLTINTTVPEKQLQTKTYNFTQNANLQLNPDTGYDGFDKVNLTINVSGGGSGDVKLFATEQAMQADPNPSLDDLAVVYSSSVTGITETSEFDKCVFPQTVVLSEAYTGSLFGMFIDNESMGYFNGNVELDSSRFEFTGWRRIKHNPNKLYFFRWNNLYSNRWWRRDCGFWMFYYVGRLWRSLG